MASSPPSTKDVSPLSLKHPKGELRTLTWKSHMYRMPLHPVRDYIGMCAAHCKEFQELKLKYGLRENEYESLSHSKGNNDRTSFRGETLHRIYIDVRRTRGEMEFFRLERTRRWLTEVLLLWCLKHHTEYTQGMNDILATITMSLLGDYALLKALKQAKRAHPSYPPALIARVHPQYLGSDAFAIFSALMKKLPAMFHPEKKDSTHGLIQLTRFVQSALLRKFDPDLYEFLSKSGAPPELYMLKWVRLLFSREFEISQVLQIWDELVKQGGIETKMGFGMVEHLCMALLKHVRYELLNFVQLDPDSSMVDALARILKFPSVPDIQNVIVQAKKSREQYKSSVIASMPAKPLNKVLPNVYAEVREGGKNVKSGGRSRIEKEKARSLLEQKLPDFFADEFDEKKSTQESDAASAFDFINNPNTSSKVAKNVPNGVSNSNQNASGSGTGVPSELVSAFDFIDLGGR